MVALGTTFALYIMYNEKWKSKLAKQKAVGSVAMLPVRRISLGG
ncbi:MAG: hypothetical protein RR420_08630 [Anaerovoracaceae bacterium]